MTKRRLPQLPAPSKGADETPGADRAARVQRLVAEGARLLAAKRPGEAAAALVRAWDLDPQNAAAAINLGGAQARDAILRDPRFQPLATNRDFRALFPRQATAAGASAPWQGGALPNLPGLR